MLLLKYTLVLRNSPNHTIMNTICKGEGCIPVALPAVVVTLTTMVLDKSPSLTTFRFATTPSPSVTV